MENENKDSLAASQASEEKKQELTPEGKLVERLQKKEEELNKKLEMLERRETDLNRLTKQLEMGGESEISFIKKEEKKEETPEEYAKRVLRGEI